MKAKREGIRMSFYLHKEQAEWIDRQAEKEGCTRSVYIERHIFPKEMWRVQKKMGRIYNRGNGE